MDLEIKVSEDLSRGDQRDFFKNFLNRTTPGIRHAFMRNGKLRDGVTITRSDRKLSASI